jgi:hypothetical protein
MKDRCRRVRTWRAVDGLGLAAVDSAGIRFWLNTPGSSLIAASSLTACLDSFQELVIQSRRDWPSPDSVEKSTLVISRMCSAGFVIGGTGRPRESKKGGSSAVEP